MKVVEKKSGSMLLLTLVATGIFFMLLSGVLGLGILQLKLNLLKVSQNQALHVAEAGVNYYRWVLYHDHEEYCNGEECITGPEYGPYGPYSYTDSSGENIIGYYELYITPPALNGSTIVTIRSMGWVEDYPNIKRTIEVECGIPSWSSYSVLANANIRFGEGTEIWGPLHSNSGIRFDGLAHNVISSSLLDYDDPDHEGSNEFGIHTHITPTDPLPDGNNPPENVPERLDVFAAGRSFPNPVISFDLLDNYINGALTMAEDDGLVLEKAAGDEGYHLTLNSDDTVDIRKVESVTSQCSQCLEWGCTRWWHGWLCTRWGCTEYEHTETEGIVSESDHMIGINVPNNGIIFVKDKVWVDGQIDGNRITILAFEQPITGNDTDIIINNDIVYTNYDGTDSIGLIAQRNISIGLFSDDDLQVDAALIAKEGRIGRDYFGSDCGSEYVRDTITINGSLATKERYGFAYTDGTGYQNRNLNYDSNLTFIPPPHFPTTGEYTFISWREIKD
jgi:hypothetical protein